VLPVRGERTGKAENYVRRQSLDRLYASMYE